MIFPKWLDELDEVCDEESALEIHRLSQSSLRAAYESGLTAKQFHAVATSSTPELNAPPAEL